MPEFNLIPEVGPGQISTVVIGVLMVLSPFIALAKKIKG